MTEKVAKSEAMDPLATVRDIRDTSTTATPGLESSGCMAVGGEPP